MKAHFKGIVIGLIAGILITMGISVAASESASNLVTLYDVRNEGIRIVIDNKEFTCTDANGAVVQPMIYAGTTYIPVRAVSTAFGKAVYWDEEENTVYLGRMDGKLQKPTAGIADLKNIAGSNSAFRLEKNTKDNYDGFYSAAYYCSAEYRANDFYEVLLDKKYSKFKATLFVPNGSAYKDDMNPKN